MKDPEVLMLVRDLDNGNLPEEGSEVSCSSVGGIIYYDDQRRDDRKCKVVLSQLESRKKVTVSP